jgi:4-hydroxyphenylpyruvate dioxygenase
LRKHGDGVKAALWVEDATSAYQENEAWCSFFMEPTVEKDEFEVVRSGIYTYGETVHVFCRVKIIGVFLPGYKEWKSDYNPEPTG